MLLVNHSAPGLPLNCPIYDVECFFEFHKVFVKGTLPFNALFKDNRECSKVYDLCRMYPF